MKARETKTTSQTTSTLIPIDAPTEVKQEIGEFLIEQILKDVAQRRSPVSGARFPALSKKYRSYKQEEGLSGVPDLQLSGDMLDALDYKVRPDGIELGIYGSSAPKADGHNNLSGKSKLPLRRFLPDTGEGFRPAIEKEVEKILADSVAEVMTRNDFEGVNTKSEFYSLLKAKLAVSSDREAKLVVLRTPSLFQLVRTLGFEDFL